MELKKERKIKRKKERQKEKQIEKSTDRNRKNMYIDEKREKPKDQRENQIEK